MKKAKKLRGKLLNNLPLDFLMNRCSTSEKSDIQMLYAHIEIAANMRID